MHHTGADKSEVHFLGTLVVGHSADCVMSITLGHILIIHIRIRDHRFVNLIQIDYKFFKVFRIFIWGKSWFFAGFDFTNSFIRNIDQSLENLSFIIHPLINHYLDSLLCNLEGFNQGVVLGNTDRCLCLHFCSPVCKSKCLVRGQGANMHFDNSSLEYIISKFL